MQRTVRVCEPDILQLSKVGRWLYEVDHVIVKTNSPGYPVEIRMVGISQRPMALRQQKLVHGCSDIETHIEGLGIWLEFGPSQL